MRRTVAVWGLLAAIAVVPASIAQNYVDVAGDVGLVLDHNLSDLCPPPIGVGSAWADYDNDGDIDLFTTNRDAANRLYRNDGDTTMDGLPDFTDVAGDAGYPVDDPTGFGQGAVFIDYDNDGDADLYVTNWEGNTLYENQLVPDGVVSFVDVTPTAGIADSGRAITAAWGDYDNDGFLDVYLAKHRKCGGDEQQQDHLFKNMGDGTFADVTDELCPLTAPCDAVMGLGFAPSFVDYDNDGDFDLYLVNDDIMGLYNPNNLWRNDGSDGGSGWVWTDVSIESGANISLNGMGLGVGDYDNDGFWDFAFSNVGKNKLLHNSGDGTFTDESTVAGIERNTLPGSGDLSITWGTTFLDYDNNGLLDILYIAGWLGDGTNTVQPNAVFSNNGDGTFTDVSAASGLDTPDRGRNGSTVDFDQDGWLDVFVGNLGEAPSLLHNQGAALGIPNNYLTLTAEGSISNRDAIGTIFWLTTPDAVTQMRRIASGSTHGSGDYKAGYFGLGGNTEGDLRVLWPSGVNQNLGTVSANQQLHLVEPLNGPMQSPTLIRGAHVSGSFKKLLTSDDQYVTMTSELVGPNQDVLLQVAVNARRSVISRLDVQTELSVNAAGVELLVYGFDFTTSTWVSFGKKPVAQGGDQVDLYLDVPDATKYVNPANGRMRLRFRTRSVNAHTTSIDYLQVLSYEN